MDRCKDGVLVHLDQLVAALLTQPTEFKTKTRTFIRRLIAVLWVSGLQIRTRRHTPRYHDEFNPP
jgi:hypothetical protein